jgi:hypothetical protein
MWLESFISKVVNEFFLLQHCYQMLQQNFRRMSLVGPQQVQKGYKVLPLILRETRVLLIQQSPQTVQQKGQGNLQLRLENPLLQLQERLFILL